MTLARSKANFLDILADGSNRVVALSGKWGTGKSHLWRQVRDASDNEAIKNAVYVSLFGASSVSELKLKIAQQALPKLDAGGPVAEGIKNAYTGAKKILKGIHSGFSALDELALIAAPLLIKGRFIVIDDIERKHEKLSIDEILGFIDDCVQNLGCRVLLILNSDQLGDKKLWDLFREKVIDQELRLETSPAEAFDIAAGIAPTPYAAELKQAAEACRVTNIRIIVKIIRVADRLLRGRLPLGAEVLSRVIPPIVLLSAIHYKGLEDGPDFDFVLGFESFLIGRTMREAGDDSKSEGPSAEDKARDRWRLLLDKLSIRGTDEFEALVVEFLKSGLMDMEAVSKVIDRYASEGRELTARARAQNFLERSIWRPDVTEAELVDDLRTLAPDAGLLDMFMVTSLHRQASDMAGGSEVVRDLIAGWITAFRERHQSGSGRALDPDYNYFRRQLHPDIEAEIRALQARQQTTATVLEVCRRVSEDSSWGSRERSLMRSISAADYESAIRGASGQDLKTILLQSMDFLINRATYQESFGGGIQAFLDASRAISQSDPASRLGRLIQLLYADAGMGDQLVPLAPGTAEMATVQA